MTQKDFIRVHNIESREKDFESILHGHFGERYLRYRRMWQRAEKGLERFPFPLFLVVETVNTCNLNCIMCFRKRRSGAKKKVMPQARFQQILEEAQRHECPSINLNYNNEPLLDPHIAERVRQAREKGFIDIRINTNATLLTPDMSEALIDAGLTRLSVSLDAATATTYHAIRRGGNYQHVIQNVENFLSIRRKKRVDLPLLRFTFVRIRENEGELDVFIKRWQGKADYVSIQSYIPHTSAEDAHNLKPTDAKVDRDRTCSQPFERLVIDVDGFVYPCCSPQAYNTAMCLGNVDSQTLKKIWDSTGSRRIQKAMANGKWNTIEECRICLTQTGAVDRI